MEAPARKTLRVLVTAASRHGSTGEIADGIASVLRDQGLRCDVRPIHDLVDLEPYDAAVIGSAVYVGHWLPAARAFIRSHQQGLARLPVWLFSSGPLGDPPQPAGEPPDAAEIASSVDARGHVVLSGNMDRGALRLAERATVRLVHAPYGDSRDWGQITAFALTIARCLAVSPAGETADDLLRNGLVS